MSGLGFPQGRSILGRVLVTTELIYILLISIQLERYIQVYPSYQKAYMPVLGIYFLQ